MTAQDRGSGAEEGQQLPGDLVGPLLGEEVAAAGHGLTADVVGVAAPDVEHGLAAGQAAGAPQGQDGHGQALAGGGAGLVGVEVVGEGGPVVVEPGPQRPRGREGADVLRDGLLDGRPVGRPALEEPAQVCQ